MRTSRRKFLRYTLASAGVTVVGATWWAKTSNARAARLLRRIAEDSRRAVLPPSHKPDPSAWEDNRITVCWVGHATVLINFYGVTIITDPTLHDKIGVSIGLGTVGPKRYIAPALRFAELPPVDLLLISHAHMDHLDLPSLKKFAKHTQVVTAPLTTDLLSSARLRNSRELAWNESTRIETKQGGIQITSFQVKHWGQRWPGEIERGYNGYVLEREGKRIVFGGDTALTEHFKGLRSKGSYEVAIMPIAAYRPWIRNHCTPEEALSMTNDAGANYLIPIHHQTFKLSEEPMDEPINRLMAAMDSEPERLALRAVGETFVVPT